MVAEPMADHAPAMAREGTPWCVPRPASLAGAKWRTGVSAPRAVWQADASPGVGGVEVPRLTLFLWERAGRRL